MVRQQFSAVCLYVRSLMVKQANYQRVGGFCSTLFEPAKPITLGGFFVTLGEFFNDIG
jgi:hypothetical protein